MTFTFKNFYKMEVKPGCQLVKHPPLALKHFKDWKLLHKL